MKALIMTLGTRGDVQPFVALARGLVAAGHEAALAAPHRYDEFVCGNGVRFAGVDDGPMRLMDRDGTAAGGSVVGDVASGGLSGKLAVAKRLPALFTRTLEDCWSVAQDAGADVVVHNGQVIAGQHVAERLGIPAVVFARTVDRWRAGMDLPKRAGRHDPLRAPDGAHAGAPRDQPPRRAASRGLARHGHGDGLLVPHRA